MNSKFYKIMLKVFMIFLFIIYFCANFSYGANKVSAKDIVSLYASGWEEKYDPSTASLTRDYMNKTLGDKVLKKIDKDYKNIKITQNDLKGLNKKQKVMLLGVLQVKWAEMSKSDKEKYQKAGHFNFDGINESINQDETDEAYNSAVKGNTKIYKQPGREETNGSANTLDDMIADADNFVSAAGKSNKINNAELADLSGTIYNIALQIGVAVAVLVGMALGIKFMTSGVDEKADVKKALTVYIVGCVVIFGAFGIWKLVVEIMQNI